MPQASQISPTLILAKGRSAIRVLSAAASACFVMFEFATAAPPRKKLQRKSASDIKKTKVPKELRSIAKSRKGGRCKAEGCRAPMWNAKPDNAADAAFSLEFCGFVFFMEPRQKVWRKMQRSIKNCTTARRIFSTVPRRGGTASFRVQFRPGVPKQEVLPLSCRARRGVQALDGAGPVEPRSTRLACSSRLLMGTPPSRLCSALKAAFAQLQPVLPDGGQRRRKCGRRRAGRQSRRC